MPSIRASNVSGVLRRPVKLILISLLVIGVATLGGIIFGLIRHSAFTLRYIFDANVALGVAAILGGLFYNFVPAALLMPGKDKLLDHSTYVERSFITRKRRQALAIDILLTGVLVIVISGLIQLLLSEILV